MKMPKNLGEAFANVFILCLIILSIAGTYKLIQYMFW